MLLWFESRWTWGTLFKHQSLVFPRDYLIPAYLSRTLSSRYAVMLVSPGHEMRNYWRSGSLLSCTLVRVQSVWQQISNENRAYNARARERRENAPSWVDMMIMGQRIALMERNVRKHQQELASHTQKLSEHRQFTNTFMSHVMDFQYVLAQRFPPRGLEDASCPWP